MFPAYKSERNQHKTEKDRLEKQAIHNAVIHAINQIYDLVPVLPVTAIRKNNTEADDVIAHAVKYHDSDVIQIVSSDKDFLQLVDRSTSVFSPLRKIEITPENFENVQQIKAAKIDIPIREPRLWLLFRALSGDDSDSIPGISGVGQVTAAKIVDCVHDLMILDPDKLDPLPPCPFRYLNRHTYEVLEQSCARGWKKTFDKMVTLEAVEQLLVNYRLMDLSDGSLGEIQGRDYNVTSGVYALRHILEWFADKEFNSFLSRLETVFMGMQLRLMSR